VSPRRSILASVLATALGCGGGVATSGPNKVDIPVADGTHGGKRGAASSSRVAVPASGVTKESPFPHVARFTLANGLTVAVVTAHALPVVQARLLVRAGSGDGPTPSVATLTGDMLKAGGTRALSSGDLLRRIETLGADLTIGTDLDSTVLAMPLTKEQLGDGLSLLSQVVREPRFDEGELRKLKARATDEAQDEARSNGQWMALHLVFRELFPERSAYAFYGSLPSQIAKVDGASVRDFHRRFYVPKNAELVLAGDLDEAEAKALAERHFGAWTGAEPPKVTRAAPRPPSKLRVLLAHRPKSVQSDVYVATLAPPRKSEGWAAVRVANQVLGGGMASRLFTDVRERRGLAYTTNAQAFELASGEQPILTYAGTETGKTAVAASALLESLEQMSTSPPTSSEIEIARGYVSDVFAIRMETIGSIADMVVTQDEFGLPDGYWDAYRKQLRATDSSQVETAAKKLYMLEKALVVVAGDADIIAPELAKLGDVTVVDPEKEFKTMRTIPQAPK
jgi:zinc protease